MQQGWVCLHRSFMEHWLYESKPFCDAMAWVDLVLLANHEGRKFVVEGSVINIERGQTFTSYRSLQVRWGWGAGKVKRYLELLERDGMIAIKTFKNGTLLTLVNYEVYQDTRNANGTVAERKRNGSGTQTERKRNANGTKQQCNNEEQLNNDNNETSNSASPAPKKKYGAYKHVTLTDEEYNRLCVDYGQDMTEKAIDYLDAYIEEKGYKSKCHNLALRRWVFDAVKKKDGNGVKPQKPKSLMETWGLTKEDFKT